MIRVHYLYNLLLWSYCTTYICGFGLEGKSIIDNSVDDSIAINETVSSLEAASNNQHMRSWWLYWEAGIGHYLQQPISTKDRLLSPDIGSYVGLLSIDIAPGITWSYNGGVKPSNCLLKVFELKLVNMLGATGTNLLTELLFDIMIYPHTEGKMMLSKPTDNTIGEVFTSGHQMIGLCGVYSKVLNNIWFDRYGVYNQLLLGIVSGSSKISIKDYFMSSNSLSTQGSEEKLVQKFLVSRILLGLGLDFTMVLNTKEDSYQKRQLLNPYFDLLHFNAKFLYGIKHIEDYLVYYNVDLGKQGIDVSKISSLIVMGMLELSKYVVCSKSNYGFLMGLYIGLYCDINCCYWNLEKKINQWPDVATLAWHNVCIGIRISG